MTEISEKLNRIKQKIQSRKSEDKLIEKIEKLIKSRDKQQKALENLEAKIKDSIAELEKLN